MAEHRQIRFRVEPDAVEEVEELIREYAVYVARWVREHGPGWSWATYRRADDPTRFVSVMWHRDQVARERHKAAPGTDRFARRLYRHVTDNELIALEPVADSADPGPRAREEGPE